MTRGHRDFGSIASLSILLSDAAAVGGGTFLTYDPVSGAPVEHVVGRGDGILFHSEKMHNVAPTTRGVRHSLVTELWLGGANRSDRYS